VCHTQLAAFQVVFVILGLLVLPAALTLQTVQHSGGLEITSTNPTPLGYTVSLLFFLVPAGPCTRTVRIMVSPRTLPTMPP